MTFGIVGTYMTIEQLLLSALASLWLVTLPFLVLADFALRVTRHFVAMRTFGTTHVNSEQLLDLTRRNPLLRGLCLIATVLALILGGSIIQAGYIAEGLCECRDLDYGLSSGFLN
jgi:uncharacterized membrane protein YccF (DUF307 family)